MSRPGVHLMHQGLAEQPKSSSVVALTRCGLSADEARQALERAKAARVETATFVVMVTRQHRRGAADPVASALAVLRGAA